MLDFSQKQKAFQDAREMDEKNNEVISNKSNTEENLTQSAKARRSVENFGKNMTPQGWVSLLSQANFFSDWMYAAALFAAIFKDLLDLLAATGILYGLIIIITFLISIFIAMMMILGSFINDIGFTQHRFIMKWLVLLGGTVAEMLFGINFLPIETLTVLIIYLIVLSDRKHSQENQKVSRD